MKNVLIISYHFYPEISPRAFRAFELARELSKTYQVDVLTAVPLTKMSQPFNQISTATHILEDSTHSPLPSFALKESRLKNVLRKVLHFALPGGFSSLFALKIIKNRQRLKPKYDAIISIGLPLGSHIGASVLKCFYKLTENLILDYGDPFLRNPKSHWSPFNYILETSLLNSSNHVVVPVKNALPAFAGIAADEKMNVIPQGLNIEDIKISDYKKNSIPKIAYAGLFYKEIRDPEEFIQQILSHKQNFRLLLLTDISSQENLELLEKYKKLDIHNRIELIKSVPRTQCIEILSTCDFNINFRNASSTQSPSKLIDYTLAKRPILDVDTGTKDISVFEQFLNEDYSQAVLPIDLKEYDIRTVAKKFSNLIENP